VVCFISNSYLFRYDVVANTWSQLVGYGGFTGIGGTVQTGEGANIVFDPDRKLLFSIGPNYTGANPKIYAIDFLNNYAASDWTSSVKGCGDLTAYVEPGLAWDPSLHAIIGYVPRTAASTAADNRVLIFDPGMKTCTPVPLPGGPAASAALRGTTSAPQGVYGKFNFFPALGKYVVINGSAGDAHTFQLTATPTYGLGASTYTCVDRDGDGYGVGPGCTGPDADDQDATVHTATQALAKWTDMPTFLQHLGYFPAHIWYVATDGGSGTVDNAAAPFRTCCGSGSATKANPAAGDAVLFRGGTYAFLATPPTGTAGAPTILMSYPGELAEFDTAGTGFSALNLSYTVFDGFKFSANGSSAGLALGGYPANIDNSTNVILRHIESTRNKWGIVANTFTEYIVEDSVFHDNWPSTGCNSCEHGFYATNHDGYTNPGDNISSRNVKNFFVRRNLFYRNTYNGIQLNGRFSNAILEQNISYSNGIAGYSWETGVNHSTFRSNVAINNTTHGLVLYDYDAWCPVYNPGGVGSTCPYSENYNLIENFSVYNLGQDPSSGASSVNASTAVIVNNASTGTSIDMGHNTIRNIVAVVPDSGDHYHALEWSQASTGWPGTSTVAGIVFQKIGAGAGGSPIGYGPGSSYGYAPYSCATAATITTISGCTNADPKFAAVGTWDVPTAFDLRLQSSSPAIHAGTSAGAPTYDLLGNPFANPRSLGAYESIARPTSPCDVNGDGVVDFQDVLAAINQALGLSACGTADLLQDGQCNMVDVQLVIVAAMGGTCAAGR
jgi:hypothetical protein